MQRLILTLALAVGLILSLNAQATLIDRGSGLIYDDVLNITWLQDANLAAGSAFDDGFFTTDGRMSWDNAVAWADALSFGGFDDWRLPSMSVSSGIPTGSASFLEIADCDKVTVTEMACRDNELGYMYHQNLGGSDPTVSRDLDLSGTRTVDGVTLENIQRFNWSGTEVSSDPNMAWELNFGHGFYVENNKVLGGGTSRGNSAWAVRGGDVLAVPEPSTGLLLAAGLAGLGLSRKRLRPRRG